MSENKETTHALVKNLAKQNEYRLALETIFVNYKTECIARQSRKLRNKMLKHNARVEAQMTKVDGWPEYLAKTILNHQK